MEHIEDSINWYMSALDTADQEEATTAGSETSKMKDNIAALEKHIDRLRRRACHAMLYCI
jgi:hypothetical protein